MPGSRSGITTERPEPSVNCHAHCQLLEPLDDVGARRVALGLRSAIGRHKGQHVRLPWVDFALQIFRPFAEKVDHGRSQSVRAHMASSSMRARIFVGGRGDREDAQPQTMQHRAVDDPWLDRNNLDAELQPASGANEK